MADKEIVRIATCRDCKFGGQRGYKVVYCIKHQCMEGLSEAMRCDDFEEVNND